MNVGNIACFSLLQLQFPEVVLFIFVDIQSRLTPLLIGHNGTINGQGQSWWVKFRRKLLNHTRGPLVQFMRSSNIIILNITLRDSPFWTLHTYDCKNVTISETTILAPIAGAPNTDGIDPGFSYTCNCF